MLNNSLLLFAHELFTTYGMYAHPGFPSSRFTQEEFLSRLKSFDESGLYQKSEVGTSGEGRPLTLYTIGNGPVKVPLWSQMHGDEPTATMAICDIFGFLQKNPSHEAVKAIGEKLTLCFLPMLNPDGAERFTRRTAQLIDMNRDALALETPEAQILKSVRDSIQPEFGFNLHDQDPRLTAGSTKKITAVALLAPAADELRSDTPIRSVPNTLLRFLPKCSCNLSTVISQNGTICSNRAHSATISSDGARALCLSNPADGRTIRINFLSEN